MGLKLVGGKKPQRRKAVGKPQTAGARKAFLEELAATCNVAAAVRKSGLASGTVYRLRRTSAAFRAGWAEALREGYAKLELMLLDRAMNGTVKIVTRKDGSVDKTHEFPNAIALALLRMHRDSAAAAEVEHPREEIEEARRRLARKLEALTVRVEAEEAKGEPQSPCST